MESVDAFLDRTYIEGKYTCYDFVREVWKEITGVDIGDMARPTIGKEGMAGEWDYVAAKWQRLDALKEPCVVLFQRPRMIPHVGVYIRGKVLHLPKDSNARFEELSVASIGFKRLSYYT